ncbi:MAG: DUF362 domain-containing protein [Desulfomonile sp.]|jgi:uncharacterized protein (DUF362 family)/ferredoxin
MKSTVTIRKCEDYNSGTLTRAVQSAIDDIGGISSFVKRGDRVLMKPNLLKASSPESAVVTHPAFVEAVASMVLDCGAKAFLGDSPPLGNLSRVLTKSGYDPFMEKMGIQTVPFSEKIPLDFSEGRLFRRIDVAREVFNFDCIINLPKLKTHCQMVLTLAVKNLFGTVIGTDKASWHLRAGKDFDSFATVLVQLLEKIKPAVSILDGILAMEGNGPNSGESRHVGIIGASTDAVALDAVICNLVGVPIQSVRTCVIGGQLGVGTAQADDIVQVGDQLDGFPLRDFKPPKTMTVTWNLSNSNPIRRFLENHMITRPHIDSRACLSCGICLNHCPPGAITEKDGAMGIDVHKCISCFCCHELCPNNAVHIVQPFLGRFLSSVSR